VEDRWHSHWRFDISDIGSRRRSRLVTRVAKSRGTEIAGLDISAHRVSEVGIPSGWCRELRRRDKTEVLIAAKEGKC
jgi:hypothetical protein